MTIRCLHFRNIAATVSTPSVESGALIVPPQAATPRRLIRCWATSKHSYPTLRTGAGIDKGRNELESDRVRVASSVPPLRATIRVARKHRAIARTI